jgi:iron-sulfur cluster repair protein YtfE (RIC family)
MAAPHLIEFSELTAAKLCTYIENKQYQQIESLMDSIRNNLQDLQNDTHEAEKVELIAVIYYRICDEVNQMIRNDRLIIFPLIRDDGSKACKGRKLPTEMIQKMHKKIMTLHERLRHMLNSYLAQPDWSQDFKLICEELHSLEQQVMQVIYLKENILLPKVENLFNQLCSGNCKTSSSS